MKEKNNPLLYIIKRDNLQYINLFPTSTTFIILKEIKDRLESGFQNYSIYTVDIDKNLFYPTLLTHNNYLLFTNHLPLLHRHHHAYANSFSYLE